MQSHKEIAKNIENNDENADIYNFLVSVSLLEELEKNKDPMNLSSILDICAKIPSKSFIPFIIIKYLAVNHNLVFMKAALESVNVAYADDKDDLTSSCYNTTHFISAILLDDKRRQTLMSKYYKPSRSYQFSEKHPTTKKVYKYEVTGLFDGNIIKEINKITDFDMSDEKQITATGLSFAIKYRNYVNELKEIVLPSLLDKDKYFASFKSVIENIHYRFNLEVMESLRNEILNNQTKINDRKSMFYFVGIVMPKPNETKKFTYLHTFVIEQFYALKVYYRLHQSWIGKNTLADDYKRQGYAFYGEGAWTIDKLTQFLDSLETHFVFGWSRPQNPTQECFGYMTPPIPLLTFKDDILTGISFRYKTEEIDPMACVDNLKAFIEKNTKHLQPMKDALQSQSALVNNNNNSGPGFFNSQHQSVKNEKMDQASSSKKVVNQ